MWTSNLERYLEFCRLHADDIPVFYQPWWLDAVCTQGRWIPYVHNSGNAIWPVYVKQKLLLRKVTMPPLTSRLGPWPLSPGYSVEDTRDILRQNLPSMALVQHIAGSVADFPFLSDAGFTLQEYSHYVIPAGDTPDEALSKMNLMSRRNIRKASAMLECTPLSNMAVLDELITKSLSRHGTDNLIPVNLLNSLYNVLSEKQQGMAWMATDRDNFIHAAILLAWDAHTVYYLAGGLDHRIPQIGASRFLLWKGIELALNAQKSFDFGGGFIPGVDAVYASMGGLKNAYVRAERGIFGALNIRT